MHYFLRASPVPVKVWPFPKMRELLYFRSVIEVATVTIHRLKERTELKEGPPFPAAFTTSTPALVAKRSSISRTFRNAEGPEGTLVGPIERPMISTPSSTAFSREKKLMYLRYENKTRY